MVLSLASVSFAIEPVSAEVDIVLSKFYKYSSDSDKLQDKQAEYGKSYYAVIYEGKGVLGITNGADDEALDDDDTYTVSYASISNYKAVEKLKVKAEFEMGEDLVESVSIVKKAFNASPTMAPTEDVEGITYTYAAPDWTPGAGTAYTGGVLNGYYYCVEIKTKAERVTGDADIIGTFEFNRKAKDGITEIDDDEVDFELNLWYENKYVNEDGTASIYTVEDEVDLKWDDKFVLKFKSDDEVTINFGTDPNEGEFTVDASGQGKMVIDFNTKANEAIWAAN